MLPSSLQRPSSAQRLVAVALAAAAEVGACAGAPPIPATWERIDLPPAAAATAGAAPPATGRCPFRGTASRIVALSYTIEGQPESTLRVWSVVEPALAEGDASGASVVRVHYELRDQIGLETGAHVLRCTADELALVATETAGTTIRFRPPLALVAPGGATPTLVGEAMIERGGREATLPFRFAASARDVRPEGPVAAAAPVDGARWVEVLGALVLETPAGPVEWTVEATWVVGPLILAPVRRVTVVQSPDGASSAAESAVFVGSIEP